MAAARERWRPVEHMAPIPSLGEVLGQKPPPAPEAEEPPPVAAFVPPAAAFAAPRPPAPPGGEPAPVYGEPEDAPAGAPDVDYWGDDPEYNRFAVPPGGQSGGAGPQDDRLIEAAAVPAKDDWSEIERAMPSLPPHRVRYVLSGVLRKMATWDLPNLKDFLEYRFKPEGGVLTVAAGSINVPGPFGETALMQAAVNGRTNAVKTLIQEGANVNAQNNDGETALMWAAAYDETEVIELLLAEGAKPNIVDNRGFNALMVAVWAGNEKAVRLLKPKSNKTAKEKNGFTVSQLPTIDVAPAKIRGVASAITAVLEEKEPKTGFRSWFTRRGGKSGKKTQRRQKTKQKKRSTR